MQSIQLTEDAALLSPSIDAPPQRLASSSARSTTVRTEDQSNLNRSVAKPSVSNRAESGVAKVVGLPNATPPKHSDAVEEMLAINRASTRSRQNASTEAVKPASYAIENTPKTQANVSAASNRRSSPEAVEPRKSKSTSADNVASTSKKPMVKSGKTMKFSDLPADVRERAMKRLVANLSKDAVPSTQPRAVDRAIGSALSQLPKLSALRRSTPEVTPLRIAASKAAPMAEKPVAKKTVAAKRSVLREVEVSDLVAPKPKQAVPPTDVVAASTAAATKTNNVIASQDTSKVIDLPAPVQQKASPSQQKQLASQTPAKMTTVAKANSKVASVTSRTSSQFVMPPMGLASNPTATKQTAAMPVSKEPVPTKQLRMPAVDQLSAGAFVLPPEPVLTKEKTKTPALKPAKIELADANESRSTSVGGIGEGIGFHSLSKSLDPLPHELHRERFRVSQVGLRQPDEYFADTQSPQPVRQAYTDRSILYSPTESKSTVARNNVVAPIAESAPAIAMPTGGSIQMASAQSEGVAGQELPTVKSLDPHSMTDRQLYDVLLARLTDPTQAETPAEQSRRQIMARHLMVLAGNRDAATQELKGLSKEEQQFLRHQLEGLFAMVDPDGHPVAGRRFSSALPKLRQATMHLSAAADALEVRGLEFCTEIEAYGQIKPFPSRKFAAGQPVILYCEVDSFTASKTDAGYETHLKGSYDVFNEAGEKVVSQLLPADKQISRNYLRDYFVAYQMNLPAQLGPGNYRLQLTMEDVAGQKYGQSEVVFQITRAAANVRAAGGTM